jgi:hypothetical protein
MLLAVIRVQHIDYAGNNIEHMTFDDLWAMLSQCNRIQANASSVPSPYRPSVWDA